MARKRRAPPQPAAAKKRRSGRLRKEEEEDKEEEEEGECGREAVACRSCATAAARAAPGRGHGGQRWQRSLGKDGPAGPGAVVIGYPRWYQHGYRCGISRAIGAPIPGLNPCVTLPRWHRLSEPVFGLGCALQGSLAW